jgi:hypothetical protein
MKRRSIAVPRIPAGSARLFPSPAGALIVRAEPDYLLYSNRAGGKFENRIAVAVAKAPGEKVAYTWASSRGHGGFPQFLSATIDPKKCDVTMNIPYGSREELTSTGLAEGLTKGTEGPGGVGLTASLNDWTNLGTPVVFSLN